MTRKTKEELKADLQLLKKEFYDNCDLIEKLNARNAEIIGGYRNMGLIRKTEIELENADYPLVEYQGYYGDKQEILFVKQTEKRVYWRNVGSSFTTWTNKNQMNKDAMNVLKEMGLVD